MTGTFERISTRPKRWQATALQRKQKIMTCEYLILVPILSEAAAPAWKGVDETVIEKVAAEAGHPAREPYINAKSRGLALVLVPLCRRDRRFHRRLRLPDPLSAAHENIAGWHVPEQSEGRGRRVHHALRSSRRTTQFTQGNFHPHFLGLNCRFMHHLPGILFGTTYRPPGDCSPLRCW